MPGPADRNLDLTERCPHAHPVAWRRRARSWFGIFLLATFRSSPMSDAKLTPMMQQYFDVKRGLPRDTLLLFRLGDFFELFFDDAVMASRLLGLTLTKRQEHPMAGLPAHAS